MTMFRKYTYEVEIYGRFEGFGSMQNKYIFEFFVNVQMMLLWIFDIFWFQIYNIKIVRILKNDQGHLA